MTVCDYSSFLLELLSIHPSSFPVRKAPSPNFENGTRFSAAHRSPAYPYLYDTSPSIITKYIPRDYAQVSDHNELWLSSRSNNPSYSENFIYAYQTTFEVKTVLRLPD